MDKYLNFDYGIYIEAGANDGISQSNTHSLERRGWLGLLVEPNPHKFNECVANRSQANTFENVALVSFDYQAETILGNFDEVTTVDSLTSQITIPLDYYDEHQLTATKEKYVGRKNIFVPVATLQSLLDKAGLTHIDFLSLDVEGYEKEAMNGLDFLRNPPTYIRVETSTYQYRIDSMTEFIFNKGYEFLGMSNENDCFYGLITRPRLIIH